MGISQYFAEDYAEARGKFLNAARSAGATLESYCNPVAGPDGCILSTETARLGSRQAERLLVVMSGTHGVEGFCGSALQIGLLERGIAAQRPDSVALLMIHAINPSGFARARRVTEGNVDLNRNFVDHDSPYPANPCYELLRDAICPRDWSPAGRAVADAVLDAYCAEHGAAALNRALMLGQFSDPDGLLYGGRAPTWSNRTLCRILDREAVTARHVALIDLHTGLGSYGEAGISSNHICNHPGYERVKEWFGDAATPSEADGLLSAPVVGDVTVALDRMLGQDAVTSITLEFGTVPLLELRDALRGDNWLYVHGRPESAEGREIKARLREAFYPGREDWRKSVWDQGVGMFRGALTGLAESRASQAGIPTSHGRIAAL
jgi:uncharacterized protein DUF2817